MIAQKVSRDKLSAAFGTVGFVNRIWDKFATKKFRASERLEEATRAVQQGTSWQDESQFKEELELLRESGDMRLDGTLIRQAIEAGKAGDRSKLVNIDMLNTWTSAKLQECHREVKQEDDERRAWCSRFSRRARIS